MSATLGAMDSRSHFGRRVRSKRGALLWTAAELARRSRLPQSRVYGLETGSVSPTLGDVVALASALGIADWRELLGEVPPPRVPLDERD
jgi:transcriptional regulator with XRE-family HTH domain